MRFLTTPDCSMVSGGIFVFPAGEPGDQAGLPVEAGLPVGAGNSGEIPVSTPNESDPATQPPIAILLDVAKL